MITFNRSANCLRTLDLMTINNELRAELLLKEERDKVRVL